MLTHYKRHLTNTSELISYFTPLDIKYISIDTETSGLHIILDKPFLMTFDVVTRDNHAFAFSIPITHNSTITINQYFVPKLKEADKIIFFNAKYDLHMLYNVGINLLTNELKDKLSDAAIYARLGLDAKTEKEGNPKLALKILTERYIDENARVYEKQVSNLKKEINIKKTNLLKQTNYPYKKLKEFLKDILNEITDLPKDVYSILTDPKLDANNYNNLDKDILKQYAIHDPIYTTEVFLYFYNIVKEREQLEIARREEKIIPILWKMERSGFKLNKEYLIESKQKLKQYIIDQRNLLKELSQTDYKIGQHEMWKQFFYNKYNIHLESSDEDSLNSIQTPIEAKNIAQIIIELRSLEKWYSTYICKWETEMNKIDRIYTSFNQCGAVSGRFSSDFQQFPKEPLLDSDGNIIYIPRRLVKVSGEGYNKLVFMDFSSEELRIQAIYTVLIGHPDLNLCRAYMPYRCLNEKNELFNCRTDLKTFKDHTWRLIEDQNKIWTPTDLHDKTCLTAFPELTKNSPEFKHYRKMAKCTNFAANYGASAKTLQLQFGYSPELANKLYNAYVSAYPGIEIYKQYVNNILYNQNYVTNLFGRRYYNSTGHKCCNYLIQGSAADYLKIKLIELDKFLEPYKSRMICMIHDEIVYEIYNGEDFLIPKLKEIMEDLKDSPIPMVADIETTTTTWDEKK